MLREHEYDTKIFRVNGASWVLIGDILCMLIFPKLIAISGMLLLSLSDSISAIVGQLFAKKYYTKNRSYLGTSVFLIIGIIIVSLTPKYFNNSLEYIIGYTAIVVTAISDSINLPVDDNLIIPIVFSGTLYILYLFFFPVIFTLKLF
jgi:dolichol kinase